MIKEKIRSILAVFISIALFCGMLPVSTIPVYAGGGESDDTLGSPMVLNVQLADCSDHRNTLVSVWRQEDSSSAKEEIGYYSTGDEEGYGSFSYIKGDILTVYVYDVPEDLVEGDTLYYAWGYLPESFGRATDPYGYSGCYAFTINTRYEDITNIVNIFYNYGQVEYYQQNFSSDLQYCILSDQSMFPVYVGPMDDGSYYYEDYSNQSAFLTSFNGWNKYYTWQSYSEVAYRIDGLESIEKLSGLILDGREYSMEALIDRGYVTTRNGYLVLKLSLLMPAMEALSKDDPRTLTVRPVIAETEARYGEFLLDFHEGAGPDTYAEVIQTNTAGTVTAETAFSSADFDENGRCLVPYRVGESIKILVHNVPDRYSSSQYIYGTLRFKDGTTYKLYLISTGNGSYLMDPEDVDLGSFLDEDSCPVLSLVYTDLGPSKYKFVFDVDNGEIFRTTAAGVPEAVGHEALVYDLYEKDLTQTIGDLIADSGKYRQSLTVKSYEDAVLEGWQFQYDFQDDDESVPEEERPWFSFPVDDGIFDLDFWMTDQLDILFELMGNPDRYDPSVTKIHLKAIWHSEGPVIVNFVPMGHDFLVSCKHPENNFVFDQNQRWWFEANGMSLFRQEDVETSSIQPIDEAGFLGWSLCRKVTGSGGAVSYEPLEEHLYSTEEIESYIPTLEYGNEICFVAQWDTETKVQFVSAVIDDKIGLSFYVALPDTAVSLVLDGPEGEQTIMRSSLTAEENGLYKVTYRIPAACMDKEIRLTLYDRSGTLIPLQNETAEEGAYSYTVRRYLMEAANADNLATEKLILAMNTYGLFAQGYFNLLSEADLPDIDDVADSVWEDYKETSYGSLGSGVEYFGASLILQDGIHLRHYFTSDPGSVWLGDTKAKVTHAGSVWYVETPGLSIRDIGNKNIYPLQVGGWTMYYSVLSYCAKAVLNHTRAEQVAKALYQYYMAVLSYEGCDHSDADYIYIGNGRHALVCPYCGEQWNEEDCDIWMDICTSCLTGADAASFDGMKIQTITPQGKIIDSSRRDHVYEGDLVTVSENWDYPVNPDVTDYEVSLYLTLPTGEKTDLLSSNSEDKTDLVEVLEQSVHSSKDRKSGTASVTFYASRELAGAKLQFEVKGIRRIFGGDAGTENRILETFRSEEKICSVKDALTMGIRQDLPETLTVTEGQSGQTLTVRGYGPGTVSYQWQTFNPSSGRWTNISGANSSVYALVQIRSDLDGRKIRCIVQNDSVVLLSKECTIHLS